MAGSEKKTERNSLVQKHIKEMEATGYKMGKLVLSADIPKESNETLEALKDIQQVNKMSVERLLEV